MGAFKAAAAGSIMTAPPQLCNIINGNVSGNASDRIQDKILENAVENIPEVLSHDPGEAVTDARARRDAMVTENLGLVHLCANRFRGKGLEYEELYSAGCIGIVKAASAFDESRGVKFSTYAVPVILGEIKRLFRDGGTVKVSRSLKELSLKAGRERSEFISKNGREPSVSELAEILSSTPEDVTQALAAAMPCISLTRGEEEGEEQDIPSPFRESDIYESIALREALDRLSPEDRKLIFLRYFRAMTQSAAAAVMGMTQVQVSRREKKILEALRAELL